MKEPKNRPLLEVVGGPVEDQTIPLSGTVTLGREPGNDLVIAESEVSRRHAEIVETPEGFRLRDVGSTNGTFVNHQKITDVDCLLKDGDEVNLGSGASVFVFRHPTAMTPSSTTAPPEPVEAVPSQPESSPAASAVPALA